MTRDYKEYVGGMWHEIGQCQFDFLTSRIGRCAKVLDLPCGSLRLGRLLIPWLASDCYFGVDHNEWLIRAGLRHELTPELRNAKAPRFKVSSTFEAMAPHLFDVVWIHSLFTHLTLPDIGRCLKAVARQITDKGEIYATFNLGLPNRNPQASDDHDTFYYPIMHITPEVNAAGLRLHYIGDWGHPRGQKMLRFFK